MYATLLLQCVCRGYLARKRSMNELGIARINQIYEHFKRINVKLQINSQIVIAYHWRKYIVRRRKQIEEEKKAAEAEAKAAKGKKTNSKEASSTGRGSLRKTGTLNKTGTMKS